MPDSMVDWLLNRTLHYQKIEDLVGEFATRLSGIVHVNSISFDIHTIRGRVATQKLTWHPGKSVTKSLLSAKKIQDQLLTDSPIGKIYRGSDTIRIRLRKGEKLPKLLTELQVQGCTDYVIFPMIFTRGERSYIAYTTNLEGGFTDSEINALEQICPALSRRLEVESYHHYFGFSDVIEEYWRAVGERCKKIKNKTMWKGMKQ